MLGEGQYADLQRQLEFDNHTLALCPALALNAWGKVEQPGQAQSFTKITQGSNEPFLGFLQRLATALKRVISDPNAREILIESLAFENANGECKKGY